MKRRKNNRYYKAIEKHFKHYKNSALNNNIVIKFKKLDPEAIIPTVSHIGEDVGIDFYALKETLIPARGSAVVPVGVAADIPHGYWLKIENRSGMGFKYNLQVHQGVIDTGFKGELGIKLFNLSDNDYTVTKGQKFAQAVIYKAFYPIIEETSELSESKRGENGFGSTGF